MANVLVNDLHPILPTEQALFQELVQQIPGGAAVVDACTGRVLYQSGILDAHLAPLLEPDGARDCSSWARMLDAAGLPLAPAQLPLARALASGQVVAEEVLAITPEGARCHLRISARPVRGSHGGIVAAVVTCHDTTAERLRDRRVQLLDEVSEILYASLDYRATVQGLAEICAGSLCDFCVVHVADGERVQAQGIAHQDPPQAELVRSVLRHLRVDPLGPSPVAAVLRTGRPVLLPEIDEPVLAELAGSPEHGTLMRELGMTSALIVPLQARGRTLGTISLARTGDAPRYGEGDVALAGEVAHRAGLAVDNARLLRGAQREAEARALMLGVVSHDLRNSLNAALMNADLLLDIMPAFADGSPSRRQMEALRRSLDLMHRLVQDLLDVDNIESGRLSLHRGPIEVGLLGQEITETFAVLAQGRQVGLQVSLGEELPPVLGDRDRVVQVFTNLISNALVFTPTGGSVLVQAEPQADQVLFRVTDTGPGIPAEEIPHVFDQYWKSTLHRSSGSGLGLTIARALVRAHGGEIWVESTLGEGCTFAFLLPCAGAGPVDV